MRIFTALLLTLSALAAADATLTCEGAPNSTGRGAVLRWTGGFDPYEGGLRVEGLPASQPGFVLYSMGESQVPWGDGDLCLSGPIWILARVVSDPAGLLRLDLATDGDEEDLRWLDYMDQQTWYFQYAYRDPAAAGTGFNLSSALAVTFE